MPGEAGWVEARRRHRHAHPAAIARPFSCPSATAQRRRGSLVPDRQVSWLRIIAAGLLPKALASVDLAHGSSVTVTGSRRIRTGFSFQLSSSHLSVVLNLWSVWPASPPQR